MYSMQTLVRHESETYNISSITNYNTVIVTAKTDKSILDKDILCKIEEDIKNHVDGIDFNPEVIFDLLCCMGNYSPERFVVTRYDIDEGDFLAYIEAPHTSNMSKDIIEMQNRFHMRFRYHEKSSKVSYADKQELEREFEKIRVMDRVIISNNDKIVFLGRLKNAIEKGEDLRTAMETSAFSNVGNWLYQWYKWVCDNLPEERVPEFAANFFESIPHDGDMERFRHEFTVLMLKRIQDIHPEEYVQRVIALHEANVPLHKRLDVDGSRVYIGNPKDSPWCCAELYELYSDGRNKVHDFLKSLIDSNYSSSVDIKRHIESLTRSEKGMEIAYCSRDDQSIYDWFRPLGSFYGKEHFAKEVDKQIDDMLKILKNDRPVKSITKEQARELIEEFVGDDLLWEDESFVELVMKGHPEEVEDLALFLRGVDSDYEEARTIIGNVECMFERIKEL